MLLIDYLSQHTFVGDNSYGEKIYWKRMLVSCYYLRSHITGCAWSVFLISGRIDPCYSHISQSKISFWVKNQILWFDISMKNAIFVKVLQTEDDATYKEFDHIFRKYFMPSNLEPQVTSWHVVHNQIEIHPVLKGIDHIH